MRTSLVKVALPVAGLVVAAVAAHRAGLLSRSGVPGPGPEAPLAKVVGSAEPREPAPQSLAGLDLLRLHVDDEGVSAPLPGGRTALLTLDPDLQRTAAALLRAHKFPEAAIVAIDPQTGAVLAYASHVEEGTPRDLNVVASAPAASVFKIVTASALVQRAKLGPDTRQCYSGGEQRIHPVDLVDDPRRDRWCVTLAGAMGRSVNTVFARLAQRHLDHDALEAAARSFGFGESVPFDVPVEASALELPTDALGFARTAAGFWNTTLSPVAAAWMSAGIAKGGEAMRPYVVREVAGPGKATLYTAKPSLARRFVDGEVAQALTTMLEHTVSEGTSFRAFHDPGGRSFLPHVPVAGKTGTLTDGPQQRLYTWFTGFAPSRPMAGVKPVAIAVLVVNRPQWHIKANTVAREVLRAHFAAQKLPGVSRPAVAAVAHRNDPPPPRSRKRGAPAADAGVALSDKAP
jgi:cell division protein FtsI/penicillin-binding protein 2